MRRTLLILGIVATLGLIGRASVQLPLLGVSRAGQAAAPTTPCDVVGGCAAAYSVYRRVASSYTGNLFQLSRTGGGGGTQDIGQTGAGLVDTAAIATFCGSAWPMSGLQGANLCAFHLIYDQSGNGNTLTAVTSDRPFKSDASQRPFVQFSATGVTGYFNNASPTGLPSGNVDKTVIAVFDDTVRPACCGTFGLAHAVGDPLTPGTNFLIGIFGPENNYYLGNTNSLVIDEEGATGANPTYVPNFHTGTQSAGAPFNGLGPVIAIETYKAVGTTATGQMNGGVIESVTNSTALSNNAQVRLGAGGDGSVENAIWYEGEIVAAAIPSTQAATVSADARTTFTMTQPTCTASNTPASILGSNATALLGLRVLNAQYVGPIAMIERASDSTKKDLFSVGCDVDVAGATTFCMSTTCTVEILYNQLAAPNVAPQEASTGTSVFYDVWGDNYTGGSTARPALTFSCLSSHPCLSFTATTPMQLDQYLVRSGANYAVEPLAIFAAVEGNGGGTDGVLNTWGGTQEPRFAFGVNTVKYQNTSGTGPTATASGSSFFGFTGVTPDSSHLTVYVESTATTASASTSTTGEPLYLGVYMPGSSSFAFNGQMLEFVTMNTAISSGTVTTLAAAAKTYWGY